EEGVLGGQSRGEGEGVACALDRGQLLLQRAPGGVAGPAVLVPAAQAADAVLREGGGLVDRHVHRTGGRIGLLPGVDRAGVESGGGLGHRFSCVTAWVSRSW